MNVKCGLVLLVALRANLDKQYGQIVDICEKICEKHTWRLNLTTCLHLRIYCIYYYSCYCYYSYPSISLKPTSQGRWPVKRSFSLPLSPSVAHGGNCWVSVNNIMKRDFPYTYKYISIHLLYYLFTSCLTTTAYLCRLPVCILFLPVHYQFSLHIATYITAQPYITVYSFIITVYLPPTVLIYFIPVF